MIFRSKDLRLPMWLRVVAYAVEHNEAGLCEPAPRELRDALAVPGIDLAPSNVTRAINTAEQYGFIEPDATTQHLALTPGTLTSPLFERRPQAAEVIETLEHLGLELLPWQRQVLLASDV